MLRCQFWDLNVTFSDTPRDTKTKSLLIRLGPKSIQSKGTGRIKIKLVLVFNKAMFQILPYH